MNFKKRPFPEGMIRNRIAEKRRASATEYSKDYASIPTETNRDEAVFENESYAISFTKGLRHNEFGQLSALNDYVILVDEINQQDGQNFEQVARGLGGGNAPFSRLQGGEANGADIEWRGWESPRAGHYFDLQGPDADAVAMPPAPALSADDVSELTAEMAEVYSLALLRDVPFSEIEKPGSTEQGVLPTITVTSVLGFLQSMPWYTATTPGALSLQARRRRAARRTDPDSLPATPQGYDIDNPPDDAPYRGSLAFRGSGPAAKKGPYVSQFMLIGNNLSPAAAPYTDSSIAYGRQIIDQKVESLTPGVDFLVHWNAYVDVQNGANFGSYTTAQRVSTRRFITTPRDLAAYVRYDQLYQAYLNACIFMLESPGFRPQQPVRHPYHMTLGPGFPDRSPSDNRQAFAQFGGPHILSLVTEVATRCLKAVRRQKFNYHRRARPERLGALLTLNGTASSPTNDRSNQLGTMTMSALSRMTAQTGFEQLLDLVSAHNRVITANMTADPHLDFSPTSQGRDPSWFTASDTKNFLLPMAFAEGSPMHPSYGAGHATVAGGCVTMLKAFFDTTSATRAPHAWPAELPVVEASADGSELVDAPDGSGMTISGELNKLAANISIGRDMAGVHYYTDYYESLRMGERIATGLLIEQMKQYNEPVEFSFESFDGDHIHLLKNDFDYADARVFVHNALGSVISFDDWWHRHQGTSTPPGIAT